MHVVIFEVASARYAVEIERLVEILPRVLVTPLAGSAAFIEGVFVYREHPCVAVSLRARFGLPPRPPAIDDHMLVVDGKRRRLAMSVDRVLGDEHLVDARIETPPTKAPRVKGLTPMAGGVLLVQDLDALLSEEEEEELDRRLAEASAR